MHPSFDPMSLKKPTGGGQKISGMQKGVRGCTYEEESQVEVRKRRPREYQLDGVVDELDLK